MKVAIIDNYDSFTYNLVHYIEDIAGSRPVVMLNDQIEFGTLDTCTHIVLSPGPGLPIQSGALMEVIQRYALQKKILGVCLGMQALAVHFGAELKNLSRVYHGVQTPVDIVDDFDKLYVNLKDKIWVGRYHSWVVNRETLPDSVIVTSLDEEGEPMSFKHKQLPIAGVQYHPESIMTPDGKKILENWFVNY